MNKIFEALNDDSNILNFNYSSDHYDLVLINNLKYKLLKNIKDVRHIDFSVECCNSWKNMFKSNINWSTYEFSSYLIMAFNVEVGLFLKITIPYYTSFKENTNNTTLVIEGWGSEESINDIKNNFDALCNKTPITIDWYYEEEYNVGMETLPLLDKKISSNKLYPYLNVELTEFYDNFLNSNSNILLLIGKAGTGKTSFIKSLLNYSNKRCMLTFDKSLMQKDRLYSIFVTSLDSDILVIEDADDLLGNKHEGNSIMSKFLLFICFTFEHILRIRFAAPTAFRKRKNPIILLANLYVPLPLERE